MIPLKEAINIFEQRKICLIRNNNHHIFNVFHSNIGGNFSSYDYIICKIKEWLELDGGDSIPQYFPPQMGKSLLDYVSKKYNQPNDKFFIHEGLQLYGKKLHTNEYIKIYINYYEDSSDKIEINFTDSSYKIIENVVNKIEDRDSCQLFENYNYNDFYNPSINYTVMGDKGTNKISYFDISVDENELKTFLDSDFFNEKLPKHVILINNAIDKYLDKVNKVFKETIDKKLAKNIEYIPYLDHFDYSEDFPKIPITETFDEFLDKHIERQEEYNRRL